MLDLINTLHPFGSLNNQQTAFPFLHNTQSVP